jgi:hypothetical protein
MLFLVKMPNQQLAISGQNVYMETVFSDIPCFRKELEICPDPYIEWNKRS